MNSDIGIDEPIIRYYDSDYPSEFFSTYPENFDETTVSQGLSHDVGRYLDLAKSAKGPILEVCCGTGRVAIPLARAGHHVTAVDIAGGMLDRFRQNLKRESTETRAHIELIHQDATTLTLDRDDYALAIVAFNSLLCIADAQDQLRTLTAIARHLRPGGKLAVDIANPLAMDPGGQPYTKPFFTRRSAATGLRYTRFSMYSPFDENNRQRIYGWYDEEDADGCVKRSHYSMYWRPIFKTEVQLMLQTAGLRFDAMAGGHQHEPFTAQSPRMFITALRDADVRPSAAGGNETQSAIRLHGDFI